MVLNGRFIYYKRVDYNMAKVKKSRVNTDNFKKTSPTNMIKNTSKSTLGNRFKKVQ